jgi:basic amino acid/polyamine antiporter, APA family
VDGNSVAKPRQLLSVSDGIVLMCGMVIGAGIFKAPSIVAGNTSSGAMFLFAWALGGLVSLCGALVYAELSSRYPETGGEYTFLGRAWGGGAAFVFAWARMSVIQTGAIAAVAFVFGDYASQIVPLGSYSSAIYAALGVAALTALNYAGTVQSKVLQTAMQYLLFAGLLFIGVAGLMAGAPQRPPAAAGGGGGSFGLAMIFVLLTYGGWNEAAYLAGEIREPRRNMIRVLVGGIIAVTLLYLLVNAGYLAALGLAGVKESKAVAADVVRMLAGERSAMLISLIVCIAALTTMNAAIFTGARTTYAMGRDFPMFARLGSWREAGSTPANALLLQGAISLALVAASSATPDGFTAMVAYTSPVFWTFFLLTGLAIFVFRKAQPVAPFRVPLYPVVPILFCAMCVYMLYSSIDYIRNPEYGPKFGFAVLAGLAVMAAGIPLYLLARRR